MAYLLAVETATKVCSVALFKNDELIAVQEEGGNYSHAENLAVFVNDLIQEAGLQFSDLDAVAVSKGPGSYTGLRIGVSFAKGLSYALNIPLISIETLQAMASRCYEEVKEPNVLVCSMIDARRMEVYAAIYNRNLEVLKKVNADLITEDSYQEYLRRHKLYFVGDGAKKCSDVIRHENAVFLTDLLPSAKSFGQLAYRKFENKEFEDVAYFEPYYLKEFIALKGKKLVP